MPAAGKGRCLKLVTAICVIRKYERHVVSDRRGALQIAIECDHTVLISFAAQDHIICSRHYLLRHQRHRNKVLTRYLVKSSLHILRKFNRVLNRHTPTTGHLYTTSASAGRQPPNKS